TRSHFNENATRTYNFGRDCTARRQRQTRPVRGSARCSHCGSHGGINASRFLFIKQTQQTLMKIAVHWKILIGLVSGLILGFLMQQAGQEQLVVDWIKPFGIVFINLLKMIAVPLIFVSLINGLADLKDIAKLSKLGGRTVALYLGTTVTAVCIGLVLANLISPGNYINEASREALLTNFAGAAAEKIALAEDAKNMGPLQPMIDLVPENLFLAMTDNGSMLQVILFAILFGIGVILIDRKSVG